MGGRLIYASSTYLCIYRRTNALEWHNKAKTSNDVEKYAKPLIWIL